MIVTAKNDCMRYKVLDFKTKKELDDVVMADTDKGILERWGIKERLKNGSYTVGVDESGGYVSYTEKRKFILVNVATKEEIESE